MRWSVVWSDYGQFDYSGKDGYESLADAQMSAYGIASSTSFPISEGVWGVKGVEVYLVREDKLEEFLKQGGYEIRDGKIEEVV